MAREHYVISVESLLDYHLLVSFGKWLLIAPFDDDWIGDVKEVIRERGEDLVSLEFQNVQELLESEG